MLRNEYIVFSTAMEVIEEVDKALESLVVDPKADRMRAPFLVNTPNSVAADETGLSDGKLISKFAKDADTLTITKNNLQKIVDSLIKRVPETTIAITHFKNWGETQDSLLMHVKPTQSDQVVALVNGVIQFNMKFGYQVK